MIYLSHIPIRASIWFLCFPLIFLIRVIWVIEEKEWKQYLLKFYFATDNWVKGFMKFFKPHDKFVRLILWLSFMKQETEILGTVIKCLTLLR